MDKPRRVAKKINYVFNDDCSDDDDFVPSPRQTFNTESFKKTQDMKPSPKKRKPTKRLSRDEQKFEKDLQLALQLSSTSDKLAGTIEEDLIEISSSPLVPAVKRVRKDVNHKEDDSDCWSEEEFKGWPADCDEGSPSPKRKRKTTKKPKIEQKQSKNVPELPTENHTSVDTDCSRTKLSESFDKCDGDVTVHTVEIHALPNQILNDSPVKEINVPPLNETSSSPILTQNVSPNISNSDKGRKSKSSHVKTSSNKGKLIVDSVKTMTSSSPIRPGVVRSQFRSPLVENSVSPKAVTPKTSGKIGLRLGLSRRGNIKPLHPNASSL